MEERCCSEELGELLRAFPNIQKIDIYSMVFRFFFAGYITLTRILQELGKGPMPSMDFLRQVLCRKFRKISTRFTIRMEYYTKIEMEEMCQLFLQCECESMDIMVIFQILPNLFFAHFLNSIWNNSHLLLFWPRRKQGNWFWTTFVFLSCFHDLLILPPSFTDYQLRRMLWKCRMVLSWTPH